MKFTTMRHAIWCFRFHLWNSVFFLGDRAFQWNLDCEHSDLRTWPIGQRHHCQMCGEQQCAALPSCWRPNWTQCCMLVLPEIKIENNIVTIEFITCYVITHYYTIEPRGLPVIVGSSSGFHRNKQQKTLVVLSMRWPV